jgi:hypothetical protein
MWNILRNRAAISAKVNLFKLEGVNVPSDRFRARALRTFCALFAGATSTVFLLTVDEKANFLNGNFRGMIPFVILGLITVPYIGLQQLKIRCPKCGALIGNRDNIWPIMLNTKNKPDKCHFCDLDFSAEFIRKSSWEKWY